MVMKKTCSICRKPKDGKEFGNTVSGHRKAICLSCEAVKKPKEALNPKHAGVPYGLNTIETNRLRTRLYAYNLSIAQYFEMLEAQQGKCAICETPEGRNMVVDHCHKQGHNRQLLCHKCNIGLGQFRDDPDLLAKALAYLVAHKIPEG